MKLSKPGFVTKDHAHRNKHLSQDQSAWTCPRCQWKLPNTVQGPSKRTSAQERHTRQCRGSDLANRTCNKCHTVWDSTVARIAHELYCKTGQEKRTCRYCQQILTQSTKDTTTKSDTDGKATYKPHMQLPHMKPLPTMVSTLSGVTRRPQAPHAKRPLAHRELSELPTVDPFQTAITFKHPRGLHTHSHTHTSWIRFNMTTTLEYTVHAR